DCAMLSAFERLRVGTVDCQDDPGALEDVRTRSRLRAGRLELGIGDRRTLAGAGLDRHLGTKRDELPGGLRNGGATRLARRFLQNRDFQWTAYLRMRRTMKPMMKQAMAPFLIIFVKRT